MNKCIIGECDRESTSAKKKGFCHRCYNRIHLQMQHGPTWCLNRLRTVDMWREGLEIALGASKIRKLRKKA